MPADFLRTLGEIDRHAAQQDVAVIDPVDPQAAAERIVAKAAAETCSAMAGALVAATSHARPSRP
jgi:hypothetical protein